MSQKSDKRWALVETPLGPIKAYESENDGLFRAQGIPFALAPRFEAPTPYPKFITPFEADQPCTAIPQIKDELAEMMLGTDPLDGLKVEEQSHVSLSITLPPGLVQRATSQQDGDEERQSERFIDPNAKIPVMVWIYGGGYVTGAADASIYDVSKLVREQEIIVVKVTYRLGLFGYIADGIARTANAGLLDQLEALRWVQKNISAFGGDAGNVTVAGQSAGGDAVLHLMACEGAPTLFRRAISESPPLGLRQGRDKMYAAMIKASKDINRESTTEEVINATKDIIERGKLWGLAGNMPFAPQYGFAPLPKEDEVEAVWQSNASKIDVFIGSCHDEVSAFADVIPGMKYLVGLPLIGNPLKSMITRHYTRLVYEDEIKRLANLMAQSEGNVWLYNISWGPTERYGSTHAIELVLLFGSERIWSNSKFIMGTPWSEIEPQGRKLRAIWGGFVKGSTLKDKDDVDRLISYRKLLS